MLLATLRGHMLSGLTVIAPSLHAQVSRDSAGVLIVENARPAWSDSGMGLRPSLAPDVTDITSRSSCH